MSVENWILGFTLMGIGMGTVLVFLCVLIGSMRIMSTIVLYLNKIFPEKVETVQKAVKKMVSNDDEAIAVALAAIMARK
ncbi:probable oxaloacetate decarboxylase gamma chain 1 [Clostridium sp. CAG:715]|nr:probable oxaloacetate decarboxylase gamma chain 1 [Clostridium sp. CAG:715]DAA86671.1 MAG TPA: oxaloacetate decarboxylase [Candidatus Gastranaerophilales bacterium HUM_2]